MNRQRHDPGDLWRDMPGERIYCQDNPLRRRLRGDEPQGRREQLRPHARARRTIVVSAPQPSQRELRAEASSLETLAGHWWLALEAAQAALHSAALYLGGQELAERSRRLAE